MYSLGTFLVVGRCPPEIHYLTPVRMVSYREREQLAESELAKMDALRHTFGIAGALYALPAWAPDLMECVALEWDGRMFGEHADEVKALAAALALGEPLRDDGQHPTRLHLLRDDGERDPLKPDAPEKGPDPAKVAAYEPARTD